MARIPRCNGPRLQQPALPLGLAQPRPCIVDLFAGVGGLSLGAARAGFDLALAVELDDHAMVAHRRNFPLCNHLAEDVGVLTGADILRHAGLAPDGLDGLVGGPPCQGFSVMGRMEAVDPRNDLFGRFFEIVAQCLPKFFVAENVLGILSPRYNTIRERAFDHVRERYVLLPPLRIKASEYGAPTTRERVFFIGYLADQLDALSHEDFLVRRNAAVPTTVAEALAGLPTRVHCDQLTEMQSWKVVRDLPVSDFHTRVAGAIPEGVGDPEALWHYERGRWVSGCFGTRHSPMVRRRYRRLLPGEQDETSKAVRLRADGFCPTLRAGTDATRGSYQAVRPIHPTSPRVITPREAARLQGFPDWFVFAPSKWHSFRQIGNSVSPIVAEAVFSTIYAHLRTVEGP